MFYAHEGNATDNSMTLGYDNEPIRKFKAFATKSERAAYQSKVWEESGCSRNVIFCTRKELVSYYPSFHVDAKGNVWPNWETYCDVSSMENA